MHSIQKAKKEALLATKKLKEEIQDMTNPPRQTLKDYCRRIDVGQVPLGFQPANPRTFDIKNFILSSLRDDPFDGQAIRDPWEHLVKF